MHACSYLIAVVTAAVALMCCPAPPAAADHPPAAFSSNLLSGNQVGIGQLQAPVEVTGNAVLSPRG